MMIDVDTLKAKMIKYGFHAPDMTVTEFVEDMLPPVEAIPKAEYEARLKADMVAILEDLDLQIDESAAYNLEVAKVQRLIRDRINALRGNEDDNC